MYSAFRIALLLKKLLPFPVSKWIARRVADVWYLIFPKRRKAVFANLGLMPNWDKKRTKSMVKQIMRNFAEVVTEFLYLDKLKPEQWNNLIEIESLKPLLDEIGQRPAILVTGHIGNWELAAFQIARLGCNLCVVVYDNPDPKVSNLFRSMRQAMGLKVLSTSEAGRMLREVVTTHSIGIVADRDYSRRGLVTRFFGQIVTMPSGYASLAISDGIPVYCGFLIKQSDGKYRLTHLEKIYDPQSPTDQASIVRRFISKLETIIAQHPEQWYLFERIDEVTAF